MMQDLILISIGGGGARFLRSLIFQLAAGLQLKNIDKIKVVIIDADIGNGNLEQQLTLMSLYKEIRKELRSDNSYKGSLFYHSLDFFDPAEKILSPIDKNVRTIREIIEYDESLDSKQRDLVDLLLTDDELASSLEVGFRGRPNMGTIGLQRLNMATVKSKTLEQLLGDNPNPTGILSSEAKIFIVSSMFGGMGSSGMPLLLRKFANDSFKNFHIGSLSYMPYYRIINGEGKTDSKHFIPRTQIAMEYYNEELKGMVDTIYYIGDDLAKSKGEEHGEGGKKQRNKAHYVEFYSISALTHFCERGNTEKREARQRYLCIDAEMKANSSAYKDSHKKFQLLVLIARYYTSHFLPNYNEPVLKGLSWVVQLRLDQFDASHKELLRDFFQYLLEYNEEELKSHSEMKIIDSDSFPQNIKAAIPYPEYQARTTFLGKEKKFDNWTVFNSNVIHDDKVDSIKHIPRLVSILENSFNSFYKERFV